MIVELSLRRKKKRTSERAITQGASNRLWTCTAVEIADGVYRATTAASSPAQPEEEERGERWGKMIFLIEEKGEMGGMKEQATQLDGCRRRRGGGQITRNEP